MADSTPRRRSSRIQSRGTTPLVQSRIEAASNKLSSVLEREESPLNKLHNIDEVVSAPAAPPNTTTAKRYVMPGAFDTPPPAERFSAGLHEMHPSKVHHVHTTVKHFVAVNPSYTAPAVKESAQWTLATPSKTRGSLPPHMSSPGFDFTFTRPDSDLSEDAKKIMDSVREEAARIKAQMHTEREKHDEEEDDVQAPHTPVGRKIAVPRGGRYSDIHKQQFKKMDSIASHVSNWKSKFQSTVAAPTQSSMLKRSNSKAGFDQAESGMPPSKSFKTLPKADGNATSSEKRVKRNHEDDAFQTRPVSHDTNEVFYATPAKVQHKGLPSVVSTPTQASLARSASVKASKGSMIPSMSRSASTKTLGTPYTEGSNKYMSRIAKFSPVKSILHRSQPKFSDDPIKVASGTHLPLPGKPLALDKDLPDLPATPHRDLQRSPSVKKQVNFTPSTKPITSITPTASPSPTKIPRSESMKVLENPNVTQRNEHKIPNHSSIAGPGLPGDFTFASVKTINFGPPTSGLSHKKSISTIRPVRPSGFPTPLAETAFANHKVDGIAHGIGNKKRKARSTDEGQDQENVGSVGSSEGDEGENAPKKRKIAVGGEVTPVKGKGGLKTPKSKAKKGISVGRLDFLSRPKERA
ncbi:MAG: hypothetical protein Q9212_006716 [Teloschistes hypoglaucus]